MSARNQADKRSSMRMQEPVDCYGRTERRQSITAAIYREQEAALCRYFKSTGLLSLGWSEDLSCPELVAQGWTRERFLDVANRLIAQGRIEVEAIPVGVSPFPILIFRPSTRKPTATGRGIGRRSTP